MTWTEIGKDHLLAAKAVGKNHPRTCVSRAYYAAHVMLAEELLARGYMPAAGRQTQPHDEQARLIGVHLGHLAPKVLKEMRSVVRRLYARRIDADYKRTVTFGPQEARDALRDASTLFQLLGVRYS